MSALPDPIDTLPGATWRPLNPDDALARAALHEAARVADGGLEVMIEESARHDLADPTCPPATNTLALVLPNGSLAADMTLRERLDGIGSRRVFTWGVTHPAHRSQGIGTAILRWAVERSDEILAGVPADLPRTVEGFSEERHADAVALYETAGFQPVRWYVAMRRDLGEPIPAMPDLGALRFQALDRSLRELVRRAHNEAFADHWGSEPVTSETWAHDLVGDPGFRQDLSFVILDGAEIAGYTLNYVYEPDWAASGIREGVVGQVGVRRAWRKRGLATALLVRSMEAFRATGMEAAALDVDADNPTGAFGVYERVGFRPFRRSVRMQRPFGGEIAATS